MRTITADNSPTRLVIHGGAGAITRNKLTPEREQAYRQALALLVMKYLK